jgi:hypothetical protein
MTRLIKHFIPILIACFSLHLNAQGLKAVWTVAPISNIDAGVAYTASLKVTNTGKETATVVTDVSLPNNWLNLSTASKPIEVQPNKSTIILITYRAPNSALSRAYAFNVRKSYQTHLCYL